MPVARGPTPGHSELPSLLGYTFLNSQVLRACAVPEIEAVKQMHRATRCTPQCNSAESEALALIASHVPASAFAHAGAQELALATNTFAAIINA